MKTEKPNAEKFYEWMQRINSIHLANTPAMARGFQKIVTQREIIMKTRVKKKHFKQVEYTDLIGIKWKTGGKAVLINAKEGVVSLNNDAMNIQKCFATLTKADYLTRESVKRDAKKVFKFENMGPLLKWFAKK